MACIIEQPVSCQLQVTCYGNVVSSAMQMDDCCLGYALRWELLYMACTAEQPVSCGFDYLR
jgi:hypothetical protein